MTTRYVALLRAISNVSMVPFRAAIEALGFTEVESFGMSGNLIFSTAKTPAADLELRIGSHLDKVAIVRTASEMTKTAADDPFEKGGAVMFLARMPSAAAKEALAALEIAEARPVLRGKTVYFMHPIIVAGRRGPLDLEAALGVKGTIRSSNVVRRIAERMAARR